MVGALARHAAVERDQAAYDAQPLLRQALRLVAHPVIRNRGTTVGSIAHADPSGEMTAVLALTGGSVSGGQRAGTSRGARPTTFFTGPLESDLAAGRARGLGPVPRLPGRQRHRPSSRWPGGTATTRCAAWRRWSRSSDGVVTSARAAYVSVAPTPLVLDLTAAVAGAEPAAADWAAAGDLAGEQADPEADIHATRRLPAAPGAGADGAGAGRGCGEGGWREPRTCTTYG